MTSKTMLTVATDMFDQWVAHAWLSQILDAFNQTMVKPIHMSIVWGQNSQKWLKDVEGKFTGKLRYLGV